MSSNHTFFALPDSEPAGEVSRREQRRARRAHRRQVRRQARAAWRASGVGWRVFPRTLLGICVTLTAVGVGAGAAGAMLFVYYDTRLTDSEVTLANTGVEVEQRVVDGVASIENISVIGAERIAATLGPYAGFTLNPDGLLAPVSAVEGSLLVLRTVGVDGEPVVATATVVARQGNRSLAVTSFGAVAAAAAEPGPPVFLGRDGVEWPAELLRFDDKLDVAVLAIDADLPPVRFVPLADLGVSTGSPVYAVSASAGTATPGVVAVVNSSGVRHTAAVDSDFAGGPLVAADGQVLGFTVPGYRPGGAGGNAVPWAATVAQVCGELLDCERADN